MTDIINEAVCHIAENTRDPFQRYILRKEILGLPNENFIIDNIHASKWYRQLADEQWEDGSYGRFHTMDTSIVKKRQFDTTEAALRRMRDLGLTKYDLLVAKNVGLMEQYLRGEQTWRDNVEKHHDDGKSFLCARDYITAANLALFDPENPLLVPFREICINQLRAAFASGGYNDEIWHSFNRGYIGTCLQAFMIYPLWLVQGCGALDIELERKYLDYIWNRSEGIYYISGSAVSQKRALEDKGFTIWLSALESLRGFSLFGEFMRHGIYEHLQTEIKRLLEDEIKLPPAQPIIGHYAESWRDKYSRKNDMIIRILRVLTRC